jgi:ubiquitin carboxyl-terminal hydrolase 8
VAYQIVVDAIPRHPDYYDKIDQSRSQLHREYKELLKDVRTSEPRFVSIKEMIIRDNKRNAVSPAPSQPSSRPSSVASQYADQAVAFNMPGSRFSNGSSHLTRDDELMLPEVPSGPPLGRSAPAKPQVYPKPQSLHGRALHQSTASANGSISTSDLEGRFAKLRMNPPPVDTTSSGSVRDLSVKMPSPSDYHSSSRPTGPRDMPRPLFHAPTHPPKPSLNTQVASSMPKEPSPTYSPARNMILPASINAPRTSARSIIGTGGRNNSMQASSASAYAPNSTGNTDSYFPSQSADQGVALTRRRSSVNRPLELQCSVEKLYDYLRMYNVLLIDVRSREEFDSGHIFVRPIICVEPTTLQDGFSAEQLHDRLVLSPDEEQVLFERRNEFDVVVYYDDSTTTNSFLTKHNPNDQEMALKRLFDTLHEFNADKPLRKPPVFLMGGIDAWTKLVGTQALKMSTTATLMGSSQSRSRAIRRAPAASHSSKINLNKRRMRDYNPIDPEEERRLLEEARKGRAVVDNPPVEEGEYDESASPMYRTTEEFLRRFPDVEGEQQSMVYAPSRPRPPPQYAPPPIPEPPSRPAPSVPRVSYNGVHERQMAPQSRAAQPPVYIAPARYGPIRLHKTGLVNFGVTCYMNSVVQCLSANTALTGIFLSGRWAHDVQRDNWKGTKGILSEAYATLLSNLFKKDDDPIRPTSFRRVCGRFNSEWGIDHQQDAKEFLEFILDHLHEDLNVTWNKTPLKQLTEVEEMKREQLPRPYVARIEWSRYTYRDSSAIGNLFAGQHASRLACMTCGTTSTTYEAFWSLSVEIPHDRAVDLRDCLRSYCSPERLSGDEVWRCPRCKVDREAMKKITITRAPDTLVVHLKRFRATHAGAVKLRTPIHFPLQHLDLEPYMEAPMTEQDEAQLMSHTRDSVTQVNELRTDPAMNGPFIYNAYAVIWHIGNNLGSGHYIAHVKDRSRGCWRSFNDTQITDFDPANLPPQNRLQNEKAYIVFYERERVAGGAV